MLLHKMFLKINYRHYKKPFKNKFTFKIVHKIFKSIKKINLTPKNMNHREEKKRTKKYLTSWMSL